MDKTIEGTDGDAEEVAWKAIEATPYLLGDRKRAIPPDDLYERVKPVKDLAPEDIREGAADEWTGAGTGEPD